MERIVKEIPLDCEIVLISDTHIGSKKAHITGIQRAVDFVKEKPNRFWIHLGDWIEAITTDDKRYETETTEQPIPELQAKEAIEIFEPIAEQGICGLLGNHERKLSKVVNLARNICTGLKIPYATESARVLFEHEGRLLFKFFITHGNKVFRSNAKDFIQREANKKAALKVSLQYKMGDCSLMACVSEDTEILTRNGWKNIDNISLDDKAVTMNIETSFVEVQKINRIIINDKQEDLYCFSTQTTDFAVTGIHDLLLKTNVTGKRCIKERENGLPTGIYKKGKKYRVEITRGTQKVYRSKVFKTIEDALDDYHLNLTKHPLATPDNWIKRKAKDVIKQSQIVIPIAAASGNSEYNVSDDMLWLVGVLIAEGSFRPNKTITISQRANNTTKIRNVLNSLGIQYSEYHRKTNNRKFICPHSGREYQTKEDIIVFYIFQSECKQILDLISKKDVPEWIQYISDRQFDIFLDGMMFGDGHWATIGHSGYYYTSDTSLADNFQIACVTHGWKAAVNPIKDGAYAIGIHKHLTSAICLGQEASKPQIKKNDKRTWCINVPNGTIFTRRNGKVAIVGNCGHAHWLGIVPPAKLLYLRDTEEGIKHKYLNQDEIPEGYIDFDRRWYCCTGSFYKLFIDGISGYNEPFDPNDLGFLVVKIEGGKIVDVKEIIV